MNDFVVGRGGPLIKKPEPVKREFDEKKITERLKNITRLLKRCPECGWNMCQTTIHGTDIRVWLCPNCERVEKYDD